MTAAPHGTQRDSPRQTIRVFYALTVLDNFWFMNAMWVLFGTEYLDLSYLQTVVLLSMPIYLIGAAMQLPTGIWADRHGRVKAHVIGGVVSAVGFLPFLFTKDFTFLLISVPFMGLGHALRSSSVEALASAACDRDKTLDFHKVTSQGRVLYFVAHSTGAIVGAALYDSHPMALIGISMFAFTMSSVVALLLRDEPEVDEAPDVSHFRQLLQTLGASHLWGLLAAIAGLFLAIDTTYFAYQPVFSDAGLSTTAIGWIYAGFGIVSIGGAYAYRHLGGRFSVRQTVVIIAIAVIASGVGMVVLDGIAALIIVSLPLFFGTAMVIPFANTYVVARTPSHLRAAALSTVTLSWNVATLTAWTSAGLMVDNISLRTPMIVGSAVALTVGLSACAFLRSQPSCEHSVVETDSLGTGVQ